MDYCFMKLVQHSPCASAVWAASLRGCHILKTKAKRGANITDKDRGPSTTATTPGRGPRVPRRRGHHARTRNCMVVTAGVLHPAGAVRRACAGPYTGAQNL